MNFIVNFSIIKITYALDPTFVCNRNITVKRYQRLGFLINLRNANIIIVLFHVVLLQITNKMVIVELIFKFLIGLVNSPKKISADIVNVDAILLNKFKN